MVFNQYTYACKNFNSYDCKLGCTGWPGLTAIDILKIWKTFVCNFDLEVTLQPLGVTLLATVN